VPLTVLEFAGLLAVVDIFCIVFGPFREALNESYGSPNTDDEIRRAVTGSRSFKRLVATKLLLSTLSVAIYWVCVVPGVVIAAAAFLLYTAVFFRLIWDADAQLTRAREGGSEQKSRK
jgi:hypothetical protein